jgi:hypothetical protein
LNAGGREKFRKTEWLISAIVVKFNHLEGKAVDVGWDFWFGFGLTETAN